MTKGATPPAQPPVEKPAYVEPLPPGNYVEQGFSGNEVSASDLKALTLDVGSPQTLEGKGNRVFIADGDKRKTEDQPLRMFTRVPSGESKK